VAATTIIALALAVQHTLVVPLQVVIRKAAISHIITKGIRLRVLGVPEGISMDIEAQMAVLESLSLKNLNKI
jgi:hypothetical protein